MRRCIFRVMLPPAMPEPCAQLCPDCGWPHCWNEICDAGGTTLRDEYQRAMAALVARALHAELAPLDSAKNAKPSSARAPRAATGAPAPWVAGAMTAGGLLTVKEARALLRMSRRNLYRKIETGLLHAIKRGVAKSSPWLIERTEIARYLSSLG
jgi:hypothetical protein